MSTRNEDRRQRHATPKVGTFVGIRMGADIERARIIEDRGNIGVGGRRLVRLELEQDPTYYDEPFRFEMPVEWLLDAPA